MEPKEIPSVVGENPSKIPSVWKNPSKNIPSQIPSTKDHTSRTQKADTRCTKSTVIHADVTEFRAVVQRLTGFSPTMSSPLMFKEQSQETKAYENMLHCIRSLMRVEHLVKEEEEEVSLECLDCLKFCCIFPEDYEFESETLVQLLMAAGLVEAEESMEDIGFAYLRALRFAGIISFSRQDNGTRKSWYKVKEFAPSKQSSLEIMSRSRINPLKVDKEEDFDDWISVSCVKSKPCHVSFRHLPSNLGDLRRCTQLRTLLVLLRGHQRVPVPCRVPYDFFISLESMQALDLSRTKLSELPSSIGNAKHLRYLDLSETLIRRLPDTVECLRSLQTLKLRNCPQLIALPKAVRKLINLRHLDLGARCCLRSMPPGMGTLTCLRTLSEFLIGREYGCHVGELKLLNNLGGKLCLSRLENVVSLDEAKEANLSNKRRLTMLELRWTSDDTRQDNLGMDHRIFEHLHPHPSLEELRILCYKGSRFPSWISNRSFDKLASITLFKCENCQLLPSLGKLESLESLSLIELTRVKVINLDFYKDDQDAVGVAFPKLQTLTIKSMVNLEEWRDIRIGDFPCLTKLTIKDCPELATLSTISNLHSLEHLEINHCYKLPSLPTRDLPSSVKTLVVEACPLFSLSGWMTEEAARDWHTMEDSPGLSIYQRKHATTPFKKGLQNSGTLFHRPNFQN